MDLRIEERSDGTAVLHPSGRLNMVSATALRDAVATQIVSHDHLIVDLEAVDFLDSSGLGALIGCLKTARQASGDLRIAAPNEQVRMVLQLTNMERILTPYPSVEAAGW